MKFINNKFLIYKNNSNEIEFEDEAEVIELGAHLFPSYYGWRIYWNVRVIGKKKICGLITEGPVGNDSPNLGFLSKNMWFNFSVGSDRGQLICEYLSVQQSCKNLAVSWNLLKKGEVNIRSEIDEGEKFSLAISGKCVFRGLTVDMAYLGLVQQQIPKNWKYHAYTSGNVQVYPYNFGELVKKITT